MAMTSNKKLDDFGGSTSAVAPITPAAGGRKTAPADVPPDARAGTGPHQFAQAIEQARQSMAQAPWLKNSPDPAREQAAAERQLKHQIAAALDQGFVLHDPRFPEFCRLDKHNQFGLVNPDNLYFLASIETPGTYVIHGKRGSSADLQIQVGAGEPGFDENLTSPIPVSELDRSGLSVDDNGEFTITISDTEPCDLKVGENWLSNTKGQLRANSILIRESLMDWDNETGGTWRIDRVDRVGQPNPVPSPELGAFQYDRAARYLTGSTKGWIKFVDQLRTRLPANHMSWPRETGQGLPGQFNSAGHFQITKDMAIIITADPSDARYQGIQMGDLWFNALDFRRRQTSLTTKQAYQSDDKKYRFVISVEDPGVENWLDPAGAATAFVFMRWQGMPLGPNGLPKPPSAPQTQIVPFRFLRETLTEEPAFSPEQRQEQLAARHRTALGMPRGF